MDQGTHDWMPHDDKILRGTFVMPSYPSHRNVVTNFGADPTGVLDSTQAFNDALNYGSLNPLPPPTPGGLGYQGLAVYAPAGTYRISGTLYISQSGTTLYGDGPGSTVIMMSYNASNPTSTTGLPIISIGGSESSNLNNVYLSGFSLTRDTTSTYSSPATTNGYGIYAGIPFVTNPSFENIVASLQYIGFCLGGTNYGLIFNCSALACQSHGFYITNDPSATGADAAAMQWLLVSTNSEFNGGWGYYVQSQGTVTGLAMFPWFYPNTFANTGGGIFVKGVPPTENGGLSSCPINGFILIGAYLAQDNNHACYVETYGSHNSIHNSMFQLAGTYSGTGPGAPPKTPATHQGYGLFSANNNDLTIVGSTFIGNSYSGIALQGDLISGVGTAYSTEAVITGCRIADNNASGGAYNGIDIASQAPGSLSNNSTIVASCVISGCRIGTRSNQPYTQNYSVNINYGPSVLIDGNNLKGYINGAIAYAPASPPAPPVLGTNLE
jgi:hypothetical protein